MTFEEIRKYLELLYFITGGPVIATMAFLALKQISVAKQVSRTQSMRDAYRLAAEQVRFYAESIVPDLNEIDRVIKEQKITWFDSVERTITDTTATVLGKAPENEIDRIIAITPLVISTLNKLETFAIFFTSNVADESVAFSSIGATYTRSVNKLLPLTISSANNKNHQNIMKLFLLWHQRLEAERLAQEEGEIRKKLSSIKSRKFTPIGGND